jgi:group I intron endonuclease
MIYYIYILYDPRTNNVRYVGETYRSPNVRLREHCRQQKEKHYRARWLNLLRSLHLKPIMEVIEECTDETWAEREIYWISWYRQNGYDLVNEDKGGRGRKDYIPSEETKQKQSESKKGNKNALGFKHTEETRRKESEALKGKRHTKERKLRQSEATKGKNNGFYGKTHTEEYKNKVSQAVKGEKHPLAKLTEEDVHEIRRLRLLGMSRKEAAKVFNVSYQTIESIDSKRNWGWLTERVAK